MTSLPDDARAPLAGAAPAPARSASEHGPTTAAQPGLSASPSAPPGSGEPAATAGPTGSAPMGPAPGGSPPTGPGPAGPGPAGSEPGAPAPSLAPRPSATAIGSHPGLDHPRVGPRRSGASVGVVVLLMLVSLLVGAVAGLVGHRWLFPAEAGPTGLPTVGGSGTEADPVGDTWISEIASVALPSTVFIEVRSGSGDVSGSGFVVREDGYIVTNHHVIAGAAEGDAAITVVFSDGTENEAELVGSSADYDLAVLKIDREGLVPLVLGDSDALAVGDPVIAVGAPLGLSGSVTSGIVSARDRPVTVRSPDASGDDPSSYINAVQADAAINRGNSGGPLIDANGAVIGVNTAVARDASSGGGGNEPGFAIPSNQVRHTVEQIIETGQATFPVVGVLLDPEYQGEGVRVSIDAVNGTDPVTPGGLAEQAGIEPGDVIVAVDGEPVSQPTELIVRVRAHVPGEVIVLTVRADDDEHDVEVVLGEEVSR